MATNNLGDVNNSDDDDEETGIANHLLDIREGAQWEYNVDGSNNTSTNLNEFSNSDDVTPITQIYQPKFLEVFNSYKKDRSPIDLNSHLLVLSIDHLISFCCWARDSQSKCNWIRSTLLDNVDLRPEVRNGLAMIFIYSFSAAKSVQNNSDMFTVLQDSENGLGIVNKTSLKIYNDPYNYFNFMKLCMSGLIDAGAIPENERLNQPKKPKRMPENKEEITSFIQLKSIVITMVLRNEVIPLRAKIQHILSIWLNRDKSIRSRKFSTAINILTGNSGSVLPGFPLNSFVSGPQIDYINKRYREGISDSIDSTTGLLSLAAAGAVYSNDDNSNIPLAFQQNNNFMNQSMSRQLDQSQNYYNFLGIETKDNEIDKPTKMPRINLSSGQVNGSVNGITNGLNQNNGQFNNSSSLPLNRITQSPTVKSLPTLVFERVGLKEWDIKENRIYDIYSFLSSNLSTVCLIDETKITDDEKNNKQLISNLNGFVSLQAEFLSRNGLLTSWVKKDYPQLKCLVEAWQSDSSNNSLANVWLGESISNRLLLKATYAMKGVISYEIVTQVGILLRSNSSLGLTMDCWRVFYPKNFNSNSLDVSFGIFLSSFFPQAKVILPSDNNSNNLSNIIVKYFPHTSKHPIIQPPTQEKPEMYQTLGTLDEMASTVLSRLDPSVTFHDFLLVRVN